MSSRTTSSSSATSTRPPDESASAGAPASGAGNGSAPPGAAGRWIVKTVPASGRLETAMCPPARVTLPYAVARPRPVPSPACFVVKNGSNTRVVVSSSIPRPVSVTRSTT